MKAQNDLIIIDTPDGSATLQKSNSSVAFRSIRGATTESKHVFVEGSQIKKKTGLWNVLELGLGTGLNFANTLEAFLDSRNASRLIYTAIECAPLQATTFRHLGDLNDPTNGLATELLIASLQKTNEKKSVASSFTKPIQFNLIQKTWQQYNVPSLQVDAYYHDPFAPKDNPNCWTPECFSWAKHHLAPSGILATYSAASSIRRAMAQAGLFVAKNEGACGKREMTLAALKPELLNCGKLLPQNKQPIL